MTWPSESEQVNTNHPRYYQGQSSHQILGPYLKSFGRESADAGGNKNVGHIQPTNAHDPFHWRMVVEKAHILTWYLYAFGSLTVCSGAEKMTHFLT